jgi:hypothetical protein
MYEWLPREIELHTDTAAADWVVSRLRPWGPERVRVASFMPDAFDAYARVFHPAGDRGGLSVGLRWSEVAARLSGPFHPDVQFRDLVGGDTQRPTILGDIEPLSGSLPVRLLRSLVGFFATWTGDDEHCWYAMWDGNGTWWKGAHGGDERFDEERDAILRKQPRVQTPHREYFLMRGPLQSVLPLYDAAGGQSPALWWSERRSWLVSTEVDAYSSYVGGSEKLVAALLRSEEIEAVSLPFDALLDFGL